MRSIDKKNRILSIIVLTIAVIVATYSITRNYYYIYGLLGFFVLAMSNTLEFKHKFILMALFIIVGCPIIILTEEAIIKEGFTEKNLNQMELFTHSSVISLAMVPMPFILLYLYYVQIVETAENQKEHFSIIQKYPYLICKEHFTRTKEYSVLGYKGVKCRRGKKCLKHLNITEAVNFVGLIGLIENGQQVNNDYYVTLWDYRLRKIRYGDFDIIEIHNNEQIKDYDFVISKIISFYNNEVDRYKPIREVNVKIIGNPKISENTKRLMEKQFLKVEYLEEKISEIVL